MLVLYPWKTPKCIPWQKLSQAYEPKIFQIRASERINPSSCEIEEHQIIKLLAASHGFKPKTKLLNKAIERREERLTDRATRAGKEKLCKKNLFKVM